MTFFYSVKLGGMVSLISTVLNEGENIKGVFSDINSQTVKPSETIIVDAGSKDATLKKIPDWVKLIVKDGVSRSAGRNLAIESGRGDVIAVFDGGTRLNKEWLENITKHFVERNVDVVAGFFKPDATTLFQKCLASATIPILDEIEPEKFLPSSRSIAFRKSVWEKVKGYPEWLPVCEDLIFDIKLKNNGFKFVFEPNAVVYWKPRENVKSFFLQYLSYAKGDGHAKLFFIRHLIRYVAYFTGLLFIYLSFRVSFLWLLPFFAAQAGYLSKFFYRYFGHFQNEPEAMLLFSFPLISFLVVTGDLAKMFGFPIGVVERLAGKVKFEEYRT